MSDEACTCPRIKVGMKVTEHRNLSPDCPVHGAEHDRQADILLDRLRRGPNYRGDGFSSHNDRRRR